MRFLYLAILLSTISSIWGQNPISEKELSRCLDTVFHSAKKSSVYNKGVDWDKLEKSFYQKGRDVQKKEDLVNVLLYLQEQLGDFHGKVVLNDTTTLQYKSQDELSPEMQKFIEVIYSQADNLLYVPFQGDFYAEMIDDIAYLVIPNNDPMGENAQAYFDSIQQKISYLNKKKPKAWILDLRCNQGGAVFPMICAINSFLSNGNIAQIQYGNGTKETWNIQNGHLQMMDTTFFYGKPQKIKKLKIAILIGPVTSSSGEQTALILKQNKQTKLFGEASSGYISGVDFIDLMNGIQFGYSTGYFQDIKGNIYKDKIQPDILVEGGDDFTKLKNDKKIQAALKWLKQK